MKSVFEHIDYVKGKPHHIRRKVAVGAAAFGSALIAIVWIAVSSMTGAFAIQGSSFALSTGENSVATTSSVANSQALAGAAAAVSDTSVSVPAHIEIVDTTPAPAPTKKSDQTILPF